MECSIIRTSFAFAETSSYWSAQQKNPNFSAFHLSAYGYLVSIGRTFTEKDQHKPNYRIGPIWTRLCGPCITAIAGFTSF